jgi:hypothetical protein
MRWILIILMVLSIGCAGPIKVSKADDYRQHKHEWGWAPIDADGWSWAYQNGAGRMLGRCSNFGDGWIGIYYKRLSSFTYPYTSLEGFNNLSECVQWVEGHVLGGHYL